MERLVATGLVSDYAIWWDARIHPKFGTLEIRSPDQPTSAALTAAFVALFQALCAHVLAEPRRVRDFGFGSSTTRTSGRFASGPARP